MTQLIRPKSKIQLGVVPTHLKFVGGLVPNEHGQLPRNKAGQLAVVANMETLVEAAPIPINCVQIPSFPGLNENDVAEMVGGLNDLGLAIHYILMVGGADPMNRADENAVVEMLIGGLQSAERHRIKSVSSTSIEEWMKSGAARKEGDEFAAAIAQNVIVHTRALRESRVKAIDSWNIEFLRGGEFQTFTDIGRCWQFVSAANQALGQNVFKVLVDAAHCGDSNLSIPENITLIKEIAAAGSMGIFHASAKTTRGCLSTDDGWIGALLTACAETGTLETVFVEVFHHEDAALAGLRQLDPRHGIDTRDGRSYDELVLAGLGDVGRRLNNLVARGMLPG